MKKAIFLFCAFLFCFKDSTRAQIITTVAGIDSEGYNGDNIPALTAELYLPIGVAVDGSGNVYIGDRNNNRVRKVNTAGIITTIAGVDSAGYNGDGIPATDAALHNPFGVAVDNAGNVYIADAYNERIRKVDTAGIITTIAGNGIIGYNGDNIPATAAELHSPGGVVVDSAGNIYIADCFNYRIRKVNTSGIITTIGGDSAIVDSGDNGPATAAGINQPFAIALDDAGNMYIGGQDYRVRKISTTGVITTVAGTGMPGYGGDNGPATDALLTRIGGLAVDVAGNIFVSDADNNRIRKIDPAGIISTYAGSDAAGFGGDGGPALSAFLSQPVNLAIDGSGNLFIADFGNNRIRHLTSTLSVHNINSSNGILNIYPNPAVRMFTVNLSQSMNERATVVISNITGELVKEFEIEANAPRMVSVDAAGVYLVTVISQSGNYTDKLVIGE